MYLKVCKKRLAWLASFMGMTALLLVCGCAGSPDAPDAEGKAATIIESVDYTSTSDRATVNISTSSKTPHKEPFSLLQPPRIYINIKGMPAQDLPTRLTSDEGLIREIRIEKRLAEYTEIVVYLRRAEYTSNLRTEGTEMTLEVTAAAVPERTEGTAPGLSGILNVDVSQREGNRTRLTLNADKEVDYDVKLDRQTLIIELKNGRISPAFLKELESEYAQGAVARINAFYVPRDETITLRVALRELVPYHLIEQAGVLTVDFDPLRYPPAPDVKAKAETPAPAVAQAPVKEPARRPSPAPEAKVTKARQSGKEASENDGPSRAKLFEETARQYAGQHMSFDFVDADIRNILNLISDVANINIVWGTDVEGKISMHLENVPWDQALEMILRPNDLSYQIEDDVVWVVPRQRLVDMEISEKKRKGALLAEKRLQGIFEAKVIEFITIKHRKASDIFKMLVGDPNADPPIHPVLDIESAESEEEEEGEEEKGRKIKIATKDLYLSYDAGTNTIIANGVRAKVDKVKQLIAKLDTPEKQVMIEARIVEATTNFTRDLGIEWQNLDTGEAGVRREWYNTGASFDGSGEFSTNAPSGWAANIGLAFGWLTTDGGLGSLALDASLALGEEDGEVQILSAPKVLTVNGGEALISRGEIQYFPIRTLDTIDYEQIPALLSLTVSPTVSADNSHVTMQVDVTDDKALPQRTVTLDGLETQSPPGRATKQIKSTLIVRTGETVVIGGIYQKEEAVTDSGVPWLMDIPFLGWLFKAERTERKKVELLIFLTPSVVNPDRRTET
ncbi:MAG: type IV pilus secretin PilQ [Deltaproteobacteria bacterium]|nr:type IV pilus secretin PilQ [Deltaproteobacteria bacterium]